MSSSKRQRGTVTQSGLPANRSTRSAGRKFAPLPPAKLPHEDAGLTAAQYEFCLAYLRNGFNATAAVRDAYPDVTSDAAARAMGSENLTKPNIRAFLAPKMIEHWKSLQMDGEEALARVALDARADLRALYNQDGKPLPPHQWPDDLANSIEAVDLKEDGTYKVKLTSKGQARRTILEQTGKIKNPSADDAIRDLATILAEKFK